MNETSARPIREPLPWLEVLLACLPGLWYLALQWLPLSYALADWGMLLILVGSVLGGLLWRRRLTAWSLPALGLLAWQALYWMSALFYTLLPLSALTQVLPVLLSWGVLIVLGIYSIVRAVRRGQLRLAWYSWALLGARLIIAIYLLLYQYQVAAPEERYLLLGGVLRLVLELSIIGIGLWLAERLQLRAGLFVVGFFFIWALNSLDPAYNVRLWAPPRYANMHLGEIMDTIPGLCMLIITPVWVLYARTPRAIALGVLIPAAVALIAPQLIAAEALRWTTLAYTAETWWSLALAITPYLLSLGLAMALYGGTGASLRAAGLET